MHFKCFFEESKQNSHKIRQGRKEMINVKPQSRFTLNCLKVKGSLTSENKVIFDTFNKFFNSIP